MVSQTSMKTIASAPKTTGRVVCGREAEIFVEVLQKGAIINATLYTLLRSILVLLESCLQTCVTYTIAKCRVNKLLMMDKGTVRNM